MSTYRGRIAGLTVIPRRKCEELEERERLVVLLLLLIVVVGPMIDQPRQTCARFITALISPLSGGDKSAGAFGEEGYIPLRSCHK